MAAHAAALLLAIAFEGAIGQQPDRSLGFGPVQTTATTTRPISQRSQATYTGRTTTLTPWDSSASSGSGTPSASSMPGLLNTGQSSLSDSFGSGKSMPSTASGFSGSYMQLWQWLLFAALFCSCVTVPGGMFCLNQSKKRPAKQKKKVVPASTPERTRAPEPVSESQMQMPVLPAVPPLMPMVYASPVEGYSGSAGSFTNAMPMPGQEYPSSMASSYASQFPQTAYSNPVQDYAAAAGSYAQPLMPQSNYAAPTYQGYPSTPGYPPTQAPSYPSTPGYPSTPAYPPTPAYASSTPYASPGSFAQPAYPGAASGAYPSTPAYPGYPSTPAFPTSQQMQQMGGGGYGGGGYPSTPGYGYPTPGYPPAQGAQPPSGYRPQPSGQPSALSAQPSAQPASAPPSTQPAAQL